MISVVYIGSILMKKGQQNVLFLCAKLFILLLFYSFFIKVNFEYLNSSFELK
tara:strand:+ start:656 stop:811 length:156 start_codon:yes stop_codon:yes gene_type:complete